jgi:hypothetical protein
MFQIVLLPSEISGVYLEPKTDLGMVSEWFWDDLSMDWGWSGGGSAKKQFMVIVGHHRYPSYQF